MFGNIPSPPILLAEVFVLFFGIGLHEYAHCKFADLAGDPTPRYYGRVTLNLTKHFEPSGTIMMVITSLAGFPFGWGRPAPANPSKMKNPRWDFFISVAAGPLTNIAQAVVYAMIFRVAMSTHFVAQLPHGAVQEFAIAVMILGVLTNLGLAIFNLIPFGPLDGHWLFGLLLPEPMRVRWFQFNRQIGMPGLFITVIILQAAHIPLTAGPVSAGFKFLTGVPFDGI